MEAILEKLELGREQTIRAFRHSNKNFITPWHFHPQHELTFIEESKGTKFIGDYVGTYKPGELVLLRSNLPHCWKNYAGQEAHSISTVIQWNKGIFARVPELNGFFNLIKKASRGIIFDKQAASPLLPLILQLPNKNGADLYLSLLTVLTKLADCPYQTLSEASYTDDLPTEYGTRMAKIHDFIEAHYARKVYLKELADLVNMTEQSFSRFFSKMMHRPFFSFLNEYRINMSCRMLIDTDRSVSEIGYECGYDSLPFFHKQFNKFKKVSPARYRKKYK